LDLVDVVDAVDTCAVTRVGCRDGCAEKNRAEERRERKSEITPALL